MFLSGSQQSSQNPENMDLWEFFIPVVDTNLPFSTEFRTFAVPYAILGCNTKKQKILEKRRYVYENCYFEGGF